MYKYEKSFGLVTIASPINNNLALLDVDDYLTADSMAVIHDGYINVIPISNSSRRSKYVSLLNGPGRGTGFVKEVKWLRLRDETIFVVLSTEGLQVYDAEVSTMKYQNNCKDINDSEYATGACVIKNTKLCVGTNTGDIWVFSTEDTDSIFRQCDKVYAHDDEIKLLDGSGAYMVSADKNITYLWTVKKDDFQKERKISLEGLCATPTSLKLSNQMILIGYDSGEFVVYDVLDEDVYARTVAHRLEVSALDYSPLKNLLLTASIDAYVKIWSFKKHLDSASCECIFSICNEDGPICGVGFLNFCCTEFCFASADQLDVKVYIQEHTTQNGKIKECGKEDVFYEEHPFIF